MRTFAAGWNLANYIEFVNYLSREPEDRYQPKDGDDARTMKPKPRVKFFITKRERAFAPI